MLWSRLRGRSQGHPTFRRQHPVGSIIVDFYCPSARLAVEVDGATHASEEAMWRDRARDHWLAEQGIEVMRVSAAAVYRDLRRVVAAIFVQAEQRAAAETRITSIPCSASQWSRARSRHIASSLACVAPSTSTASRAEGQ